MKKQIKIEGGKDTPSVLFQIETGEIEIKGRSFPESGEIFYRSLIDAVDEITSDKISIKMKFEYASSSTIRELVKFLKKLGSTGKDLKVFWIYEEGDFDMQETGEDIEQVTGIPFIYIINKEE